MGLEEFIVRESAPDDLWIFIHIPKTAGSSFGSEIAELRRPYRNIHVDYEDRSTPHEVKLENTVAQFIEDFERAPFRACSGHLHMRHVLRIRRAIPRARIITLVRNPIERVISDFRYARTPAHPPHKDFIKQFPTIDSYVVSPASQNKMFRFLTPDPDMRMAEFFDFIDDNVSFVGLTEMYAMSVNITARLFGSDRLPTSYKRKTEPTGDNQVERTPELVNRIRETNVRDFALFRFVKKRLLSGREQWLASQGVRSLQGALQ